MTKLGGSTPTVGGFRFFPADDLWQWSDEVGRIHGRPAGYQTTTEEMLAAKHPDDRESVRELIARVVAGNVPLSSHHRIVRTDGAVRDVVIAAYSVDAGDEGMRHIEGLYIDVTDTLERERQSILTQSMADLSRRREAIEQAKGMLMLSYQVPAGRAFDILKWRSQETNAKLHDIARQIIDRVLVSGADVMISREEVDRIVLTVGTQA